MGKGMFEVTGSSDSKQVGRDGYFVGGNTRPNPYPSTTYVIMLQCMQILLLLFTAAMLLFVVITQREIVLIVKGTHAEIVALEHRELSDREQAFMERLITNAIKEVNANTVAAADRRK